MAVRTVARAQVYHGGPKTAITGGGKRTGAGAPAPAWRARNMPGAVGSGGGPQVRSKVLLSNLPVDVDETEIVDLMGKMVGPVVSQSSLMVYNEKGFPRGMAIVAFARPGDAAAAKEKFHDKIIDGKRPIKLEIIVDQAPAPGGPASGPPRPKSLFERIEKFNARQSQPRQPLPPRPPNPAGTKRPTVAPVPYRPPASGKGSANAPVRKKQKKGPKRIKKTQADLDREMDEYIAARPGPIPATA